MSVRSAILVFVVLFIGDEVGANSGDACLIDPASAGCELAEAMCVLDRPGQPDFDKAITHVLAAITIQSKPDSSEYNRRYGLQTLFYYLPYYYLGRIHYLNRDCVAAKEAFVTSVIHGEVQKRARYWERMMDMADDCGIDTTGWSTP